MTNEIEKVWKNLVREIDQRLIGEWTGIAINEIKIKTPVITGRLKGSIDGDGDFDGKTIRINTEADPAHFVETGVEYAAYVEFGTERMSTKNKTISAINVEGQPFKSEIIGSGKIIRGKAQKMFKRGLDVTEKIIEEDVANFTEEELDKQLSKFLKGVFK